MDNKNTINTHELLQLIKKNSRKNQDEEGLLDFDIFIGFSDGTYEGIEVDTSYHISVADHFIYPSDINEFLDDLEDLNDELKIENSIHYFSEYFKDGNVFELEDIDRVFKNYTIDSDNFILVYNHFELLKAMTSKKGASIVVQWTR